jgi:hypothetical protein
MTELQRLDPVRDGAKRISIAVRELARPSDALEILEEEEIGGLCWHGTSSSSQPKTTVSLAQ